MNVIGDSTLQEAGTPQRSAGLTLAHAADRVSVGQVVLALCVSIKAQGYPKVQTADWTGGLFIERHVEQP